MSNLTRRQIGDMMAQLETKGDDFLEGAQHAWSKNTIRMYASRWKSFLEWCLTHNRPSLPANPRDVAEFLRFFHEQKGYEWNAPTQASAAIAAVHKMHGLTSPTKDPAVQLVMSGCARRSIERRKKKARPISLDELRLMSRSLGDSHFGIRDRAMILVAFAGGLRASELVNIRIEHLSFEDKGMVIYLPKSKTDQEGTGIEVALSRVSDPDLCPFRAVRRLLSILGEPDKGWLFPASKNTGKTARLDAQNDHVKYSRFYDRVRSLARDCGISGGSRGRLTTHSFRAGMATRLLEAGVDVAKVAQMGRWSTINTVLHYDRRGKWNPEAFRAMFEEEEEGHSGK